MASEYTQAKVQVIHNYAGIAKCMIFLMIALPTSANLYCVTQTAKSERCLYPLCHKGFRVSACVDRQSTRTLLPELKRLLVSRPGGPNAAWGHHRAGALDENATKTSDRLLEWSWLVLVATVSPPADRPEAPFLLWPTTRRRRRRWAASGTTWSRREYFGTNCSDADPFLGKVIETRLGSP